MKLCILIPMTLLYFVSVALTENKPYLLATVLFYNDGIGHQIVCTGRIPKKIIAVIRKDIKSRLGNTTAKIVPLFRHIHGSTAASDVADFVKDRFDHVYLTEIPKWLASKLVFEKNKITKNLKTDKLEDLTKGLRENEQAVETNSIAQEKSDKTNILSINNIAPLPKAYYMPNTVFYAVETKCQTETDYSGNLKKSHHDNAFNKNSFKSLYFKRTTPWYSRLNTQIKT